MDKNKIIDSIFSPAQNKFWLSLLFFLVIVVGIYSVFSPIWETNDDVAMSMVAHGYGLATSGTPNIVFSNVLWGGIVRSVPTINGVMGYSLATLSVLVLTGAAFLYFLSRAGAGVLCISAVMLLVMLRPLLFPQFTVNAGLLSVAAVLCWYSIHNNTSKSACVAAFALSSSAYLIRSHEFILVIIIALPLLPIRKMYDDKACRCSIILLFITLIGFSILDRQAYQSESWKSFNSFNLVRAKFTDFGAGPALKARADILEANDYSANDVDLVTSWFFADPDVANTQVLESMISELGFIPDDPITMSNIVIGIKALWDPKVVFLTLAGLILAVAFPRVIFSWCLFILAICLLSLLGRPGILRVYVPVLCLLTLSPLILGNLKGLRKYFIGATLLAVALINSYFIVAESNSTALTSKLYLADLAAFPTDPVVVWGAGLPYESLYPVLGGQDLVSMKFKIYALGVFTLAPFSLASMEQQQARGFERQVSTSNGIKIVGAKMPLLERYCREHFAMSLVELERTIYGSVQISRVRCGI